MMRLCRRRKIDLILVKSFSRLAATRWICYRALRELRDLGVDIYFEEENLWLYDKSIRVPNGHFGYVDFVCYGYKRGDDGRLAIDEPDVETVRKVFQTRVEDKSLGAISDWLYENKVLYPTGKERWSRETISMLLKNEKYTGNLLLQKTFMKDVLAGKQFKNCGELERYLIQHHHPMIVSRELFERVNPGCVLLKR